MTKSRTYGFTLIELLAVMGIMVIMGTIAVTSYVAATRGAGMRSSLNNLRATLLLARQSAMANGKRTYVECEEDGYSVWQRQGYSDTSGDQLVDLYSEWTGLIDLESEIRNLTRSTEGKVYEMDRDTVSSNYYVRVRNVSWSVGDEYGLQVHAKTFLPNGYRLIVPSDEPYFEGDGTTRATHTDLVIEEVASGYERTVRIAAATGFVQVVE